MMMLKPLHDKEATSTADTRVLFQRHVGTEQTNTMERTAILQILAKYGLFLPNALGKRVRGTKILYRLNDRRVELGKELAA